MRKIQPSEPIAIQATGSYCTAGGVHCWALRQHLEKCGIYRKRLVPHLKDYGAGWGEAISSFERCDECLRDEVKE